MNRNELVIVCNVKRLLCAVMIIALLFTGCAAEEAIVYPKVDEKTVSMEICTEVTDKQGYDQLADEADVVLVADVEEALTKPCANGVARCYARLTVRETIKGTCRKQDTIYVQENGRGSTFYLGEDGEIYDTENGEVISRTTLCGGPMMVKGNRVLLFLTGEGDNLGSEENPYEITPGSSGKFYLDRDGKYHNSMLYYKEYDENVYKFYSQLADMTPKTLDEIKALING